MRTAMCNCTSENLDILNTSFRGASKMRTRNLEIPGLVLAHHPGMTTVSSRPVHCGLLGPIFGSKANKHFKENPKKSEE
jgi:hypothetical protein